MIEKAALAIAVSIATFLIFGSLSEFAVIVVEDALAPLQSAVNDSQHVKGESRITFFDKLVNTVTG